MENNMKKITIIVLYFLLTLPLFAANLFHVDVGTGSFKDRVSDTLPTNTGVVMSVTEKGTAGDFSANVNLNYGDIQINGLPQAAITMILKIRDNTVLNYALRKSSGSDYFLLDGQTIGRIFILFNNSGSSSLARIPITAYPENDFFLLHINFDGSGAANADRIKVYVNGGSQITLSFSGTIPSTLPDMSGSPLYLGANSITPYSLKGEIAEVLISDTLASSATRASDYADFLRRFHIMKPMVTNRGAAGQIVSWSADTQLRADGRTVTSGDLDGLRVASGSFDAKENADGKYVECATNGTLYIQGIDLSAFIGNGYIQSIGGTLSSEAGKTVDAATGISFADNTVSITLTAGQTFSGIVITPD